jgi:hypothetical protein
MKVNYTIYKTVEIVTGKGGRVPRYDLGRERENESR